MKKDTKMVKANVKKGMQKVHFVGDGPNSAKNEVKKSYGGGSQDHSPNKHGQGPKKSRGYNMHESFDF